LGSASLSDKGIGSHSHYLAEQRINAVGVTVDSF